MLDILIRNIKVIDGTGNPWFRADVGIKDRVIARVGNINEEASTVIEGEELYLSPGFIDPHGHEDGYIFSDSSVYVKLSQGITTDISGNCGISLAPVNERHIKSTSQVVGTVGFVPFLSELTTFNRFIEKAEELKSGINNGFYTGHGAIRIAAMGLSGREPDRKEMDMMKDLLRESLESGAFGMSTGLIYPPGCFSKKDEIIELAEVLGEKGGIYATHVRNEGDQLVEAVEEAIDVGRKTGVPVIISHHKAMGRNNWGKVHNTLRMIERANDEGIEVGLDVYPYTAICTGLRSILPPSCFSEGIDSLLKKLEDTRFRENIKDCILNNQEKFDNFVINCGLDRILVTIASETPEAVGKTIAEYADMIGKEPLDTAIEILAKNKLDAYSIFFILDENDVEEVIKSPLTMIGSDGIPIPGGSAITHPRLKGTFPRILGKYVREKKVLRLEEAIRKMTSLPSQRLRLKNKGLIKEGFDADLVIFDFNTIGDKADYINCYAENEGIKYVIVNGKIALFDNRYTGAGSGIVIRK